ncbi:MAG: hypothetical protein HC795_05705 [Coleofasciculaceae cyanobacterium RL_1_1]|nr:hypothetical protein [Coleofasciculaceae cyanobacterium RL_1_1]
MQPLAPAVPSTPLPDRDQFQISPLVRITLLGLYISLTIPLPFLAQLTAAPVPPWALAIGLVLGLVILVGVLSEQVTVDMEGITVGYPAWIRGWRSGWSLPWSEITALKPRTTGQGGLVYYFVTKARDRAYLLPMRVVGFARLVRYVEAKTAINTRDVKPLAQPWMYLILLGCTLVLLAFDSWTIGVALSLGTV